MNSKRYRVLILVMALLIIGTRSVCMAQFAERAEIQKAESLVTKSKSLPATRTTQLCQGVKDTWDQRNVSKFVFRVKRFVLSAPRYQRDWTLECGHLSPLWDREPQTISRSQSGAGSPHSKIRSAGGPPA